MIGGVNVVVGNLAVCEGWSSAVGSSQRRNVRTGLRDATRSESIEI